jgi:DNA (cytosine-5)-methyltransferase 1
MNELALFAGSGGGILGGRLLGWRTRCAVEIDSYARSRLLDRQRDGHIDRFPVWDDVRTFDGRPWRNTIDVVTGGFPCQDISPAGGKQGIAGERSGLWGEMARVVREVRPRFVLVENSAALAHRGLGTVLRDLAVMGFDARWGVFSACAFGAPHMRRRMFILADSHCRNVEIGVRPRPTEWQPLSVSGHRAMRGDWMERVAGNARSGAGLADRVDRTRAIGNGQVPAVVAGAWRLLMTYNAEVSSPSALARVGSTEELDSTGKKETE